MPFTQLIAILAPADTRSVHWPTLNDMRLDAASDTFEEDLKACCDREGPFIVLHEDDLNAPNSALWLSTIAILLPPDHGITTGIEIPWFDGLLAGSRATHGRNAVHRHATSYPAHRVFTVVVQRRLSTDTKEDPSLCRSSPCKLSGRPSAFRVAPAAPRHSFADPAHPTHENLGVKIRSQSIPREPAVQIQ